MGADDPRHLPGVAADLEGNLVGSREAPGKELERLGGGGLFASYVDADDRTTVRDSPDTERLGALSEDEQRWLSELLDRLPDSFDDDSGDAVTSLIYGVPKLARGLAVDDAPTDEVKADQKAFFKLLYNLLVDADRGPRLPTLFVALGPDRVRSLLTT